VRQRARDHSEGSNLELIASIEIVELICVCEHLRSVEPEDRIECSGKGVYGESRCGHRLQRASAQEWVQVCTVIRMSMRHQDCVDSVGGHHAEQSRHDGVSRIQQHTISVFLEQIAAAGLIRIRPRAAATEHG
jgi:hypothetical protein